MSCSGHGRAYSDGVIVDECNFCYGGPDCSQLLPACVADADRGDPTFLDPFWVQHGAKSAVLVAAVHALSTRGSAQYQEQTDLFRSLDFQFEGDTSLWKNNSDGALNLIEFVTAPNHPDGQLNEAVVRRPYAKAIHDHAYYRPHFTEIPAPADEDIMIFTLSKLTGHAGTRFGWALSKDESVHQRKSKYILLNVLGVSRDDQPRALKILKVV